jgi:hypothetical protein
LLAQSNHFETPTSRSRQSAALTQETRGNPERFNAAHGFGPSDALVRVAAAGKPAWRPLTTALAAFWPPG